MAPGGVCAAAGLVSDTAGEGSCSPLGAGFGFKGSIPQIWVSCSRKKHPSILVSQTIWFKHFSFAGSLFKTCLLSPSWAPDYEQLHWKLNFSTVCFLFFFSLSCHGSNYKLCPCLRGQVCWAQIGACSPWHDSLGKAPAGEYWSPGLACCSAVLLVEFRLPITTLPISILWGDIATEGKKTELLQRILWAKWSLLTDKVLGIWLKWVICGQFPSSASGDSCCSL